MPFTQSKSCLEGIVSGLEISQHRVAQPKPTISRSHPLRLVPSVGTILEQSNSNLSSLDVVSQANQIEVRVKLMHESAHAHPIHLTLKVVGQTRFDCRGQNRRYRLHRRDILRSQLLIGMCKINLELCNLGLQARNYLGNVNLLLLRHSCYTGFDNAKLGVPEAHTHNHRKHRYDSIKMSSRNHL